MDRFVAWRPSSREAVFVVGVALALALIAVAALRSGVGFSGSDGRSPEQFPARGASVVSVESVEFPGFDGEPFSTLTSPAASAPVDAGTMPVGSVPPRDDGGSDGTGGGTNDDDGLTGVEPVDDAVDEVVDVLPIDPTGTVDVPEVNEELDQTVDGNVIQTVDDTVGGVVGVTGQL